MITIEQINQKIINEWECIRKTRDGIQRYRKSNQFFAVDGAIAYDVTPFEFEENGAHYKYEPVIMGGSVFLMLPDEGQAGMLMVWTLSGHDRIPAGQRLLWGPLRWVYTRELDLSPAEVAQNIAEQIDAGENLI